MINFITRNCAYSVIPEALTHWGRVTHICVIKLTLSGSDNGLSPYRRQAIIWTNVGILLIGPLGTNFSETLIGIYIFIPPPNEVGGGVGGGGGGWGGGGGILDSPCLSVRPSVRPSVCRRHGFRSISQVCLGISISNFICMLMVAIGRSLLIFSDVTFKMAAWRPYWIFLFPGSNFTLALNINFKLQWHNTYVYG